MNFMRGTGQIDFLEERHVFRQLGRTLVFLFEDRRVGPLLGLAILVIHPVAIDLLDEEQ